MKRNPAMNVFVLSGMLLVFGACTSLTGLSVQKRQHRSGYYVEWGNGKVKRHPVKQITAFRPPDKANANVSLPVLSTANEKVSAPASIPSSARQPDETVKKPATQVYASVNNTIRLQEEYGARDEKGSVNRIPAATGERTRTELTRTTPEWLIVLLCIFIPPLAVYLTQGIGNPFWIDLTLAFLGLGVLSAGFFGLFWIAAMVYAFVIIF